VCDRSTRSAARAERGRSCPYLLADPCTHMSYLPRYRWLLVGERGSGSAVHRDPAGTSAFNALIIGSKRWVFFPPDTPQALLCVAAGAAGAAGTAAAGGEAAHPYSADEWFRMIYPRLGEGAAGGVPTFKKRWEVTQCAGEIVYVPKNWWHAVLNLELTVAVTQNFGFAPTPAKVATGAEDGGEEERALLHRLREEFEAYDAQSAASWWRSMRQDGARRGSARC